MPTGVLRSVQQGSLRHPSELGGDALSVLFVPHDFFSRSSNRYILYVATGQQHIAVGTYVSPSNTRPTPLLPVPLAHVYHAAIAASKPGGGGLRGAALAAKRKAAKRQQPGKTTLAEKRRALLAGPAVDDSDTDSEDDAPAATKKKTAAAEPEMYDGVTSVGIGSILSAPARGKRISGCCLFDPLGGHCQVPPALFLVSTF